MSHFRENSILNLACVLHCCDNIIQMEQLNSLAVTFNTKQWQIEVKISSESEKRKWCKKRHALNVLITQ